MKETFSSRETRNLMRKILTEDEVRLLSRQLEKLLGPAFAEISDQYGLSIEDSVRFHAVGTRLREARENRGMDRKAAAKALRVPQYRLREVEECHVKHVKASVLQAYVDFLSLRRWFTRWRKANVKLATRLSLDRKSAGQ